MAKTIRLITIILLLVGTASGSDLLSVKGSYILPSYPELAARARVEGSFRVRVDVENGDVTHLEVITRKSTSLMTPKLTEPNQLSDLMIEAIKLALSRWQFEQNQKDSFQTIIVFRIVGRSSQESGTMTVYRIQEQDFRPPSEIVIETHRPLLSY